MAGGERDPLRGGKCGGSSPLAQNDRWEWGGVVSRVCMGRGLRYPTHGCALDGPPECSGGWRRTRSAARGQMRGVLRLWLRMTRGSGSSREMDESPCECAGGGRVGSRPGGDRKVRAQGRRGAGWRKGLTCDGGEREDRGQRRGKGRRSGWAMRCGPGRSQRRRGTSPGRRWLGRRSGEVG